MPIFVYVCRRCNVTAERLRKVEERERDLPECPECHRPMQPGVTAPNAQFPGAASWRAR